MSEWDGSTRRDFIKGTAYGALGVALGLGSRGARAATLKIEERARVILIRDPEVRAISWSFRACASWAARHSGTGRIPLHSSQTGYLVCLNITPRPQRKYQ